MNGNPKIALIGAGAVGSYVVQGLYDKFGENFMILADGERARRLMENGLLINGRRFSPRVISPAAAKAEALDFLIVAVKYKALEGALDDIEAAVCETTTVVSLMNGIDSEQIIAGRIGRQHLLYSFIKIASTRQDGEVSFALPFGNSGIFVGEVPQDGAGGPADQTRARAFGALFDGTDVVCHVSEDVLSGMWDKFALNISRNLPQAVLGAGIGVYEDSSYAADLSRKLRQEIIRLAAAQGITVPAEYKIAPASPAQRYSTLQDLDAGRETEIEMFSGAAVRIGRKLGIPCPYNEVMYDLIKALEEKNAGKFDY